jgi:hypothetical protein
VTLNIYDSARARSVGRKTVQAKDLAELPAKLSATVEELVKDMIPARVASAEVSSSEPAPGGALTSLLLWGGAFGVVVGVVGAGALGFVVLGKNRVTADPTALTDAKSDARKHGRGALAGSAAFSAVAIGGAVALGLAFVE